MWDLPGPGLEPVPPALAGGFLTTVPPGKSRHVSIDSNDFPSEEANFFNFYFLIMGGLKYSPTKKACDKYTQCCGF